MLRYNLTSLLPTLTHCSYDTALDARRDPLILEHGSFLPSRRRPIPRWASLFCTTALLAPEACDHHADAFHRLQRTIALDAYR